MLLYEITLPNGFVVDLSREMERNNNAKKVEMKKGSANYYYDEVNNFNLMFIKTMLWTNNTQSFFLIYFVLTLLILLSFKLKRYTLVFVFTDFFLLKLN